jgi:cyclic pyranopterin phosphate synthase
MNKPVPQPLVDTCGRVHTNLRISVTDRCNIRCFYCMPLENVQFKPRHELLTFEEMVQFVRALAPLGIEKVRVTGGEPLVRSGLPRLIEQLARVPGIRDLAMTTNGLLLAEQAAALRSAGLQRLNISLDAMSAENFERIARRNGLDRVLEGIAAAQSVGFAKIRLNAVAIRGITEHEAIPLARFARDRGLELRFIEFMPLDAESTWNSQQVLTGAELRKLISQAIAPLYPVDRADPAQPAVDFAYADGQGNVGFINPVSEPFCGDCNRLRITADGKLRNCLFSTAEWDVRQLLRSGADDETIRQTVRECVWHKKPAHGIDTPQFQRPERAMYQIGG